jgi:hypothetical protein
VKYGYESSASGNQETNYAGEGQLQFSRSCGCISTMNQGKPLSVMTLWRTQSTSERSKHVFSQSFGMAI